MSKISFVYNLPFTEAINWFKSKVQIPTATYKDLEQEMYSRAFVVAGAMTTEIVSDFYQVMVDVLEKGLDKQYFEKEFNNIVNKHGWSYHGNAGWRSDVIMDTNISAAYNAGKMKQDMDPILIEAYPYWQYKTRGDLLVRPEHGVWNNYAARYDDPIWKIVYPPNGYNCRCEVETLDEDAYNALPKKFKKFPELEYYEEFNKETGLMETRIKGINRGFETSPMDYWLGQAAKQQVKDNLNNVLLLTYEPK